MYKIFKRSATNWQQFARARKYHVCYAQTVEQAVRICSDFNDNRSPAQVKRGTKYEFTS